MQGHMSFVDREVRCLDCGAMFVFSAGEQRFFEEKGFTNVPKRCRQCKSKRSPGRRQTETRVTCSSCGTPTIVPFKPTQGRPVLCRNCFSKGKSPNGEAA